MRPRLLVTPKRMTSVLLRESLLLLEEEAAAWATVLAA